MKKFLAGAAIILALGAIAYALDRGREEAIVEEAEPGRVMSIEDYFRLNISAISPVKESLGGTFYVTSIEVRDGAGVVSYEDGHNAYVADFTYSNEPEHGAISIETFQIRQ